MSDLPGRTSWRSRTDVDVRVEWKDGWWVTCRDCGWNAERFYKRRDDADREARWHVDTAHHCVCTYQPQPDAGRQA